MTNPDAIGLLETQGLVAALHATDEMLKAAPWSWSARRRSARPT